MAFASGIGTYLRNLLPRLAASAKDVAFVGLAREADIPGLCELAPAVSFRVCGAGVYSPGEQLALRLAIPRDATAFWAPHFNLPLLFRGRLLVTVHDLFPYALARSLDTRWDKLFYTRAMLRAVKLRADRILCVSQFTAAELTRFLGPLRQPVSVVHNGVDAHWFEDRSDASPRSKPYVLYVGNVKPHKNVRRLLDAFAKIAAGVRNDLVIAGEREGFADRQLFDDASSARLRDEGRIVYSGRVSDSELRRLVAHADALVLPSLYEGFGLPPLEAMAAGVPVLVSRAGALPEVCGEAALYCDPLDVSDIARQLTRVLGDLALRLRLRRAGPLQARRFDWDRSAELTLAALRAL